MLIYPHIQLVTNNRLHMAKIRYASDMVLCEGLKYRIHIHSLERNGNCEKNSTRRTKPKKKRRMRDQNNCKEMSAVSHMDVYTKPSTMQAYGYWHRQREQPGHAAGNRMRRNKAINKSSHRMQPMSGNRKPPDGYSISVGQAATRLTRKHAARMPHRKSKSEIERASTKLEQTSATSHESEGPKSGDAACCRLQTV